jgi:plasmid stabilization system protein ParE
MLVRYTLRAQFDLDDIYTHLDRFAPANAQSVKNLIERRITGLADFPFMAPETEVSGIHQLTIVQYPYKVYYKVERDEVWILHVRDRRRRPWKPTHDLTF